MDQITDTQKVGHSRDISRFPTPDIRAVIAAAVSAADRFMPAFNFLVWAGKSPREAIDAVMFETHGEA